MRSFKRIKEKRAPNTRAELKRSLGPRVLNSQWWQQLSVTGIRAFSLLGMTCDEAPGKKTSAETLMRKALAITNQDQQQHLVSSARSGCHRFKSVYVTTWLEAMGFSRLDGLIGLRCGYVIKQSPLLASQLSSLPGELANLCGVKASHVSVLKSQRHNA